MSNESLTFSIQKAHETQKRLCKRLILEDRLPQEIRYVAGVDTPYRKETSICAVAVLDYPSLTQAEVQTASCKTPFPYIPTLLSFREIPPTVLCIKKLRLQPDIFLVDGHGYAHPYRCGFASHLGIVLGRPTIGVGKSRLIGHVQQRSKFDDIHLLSHKGEVIGSEITTKHGSKPVYVSIGHMVSLKTAIGIVKHCTLNNRIPEPILVAHRIATDERDENSIIRKRERKQTSESY